MSARRLVRSGLPNVAGARPLLGRSVRASLPTAELYEHAIRAGEGLVAADGPLVVRTGKHTGRSPEDKFLVREPGSEAKIWWGSVNRPISEEHYERLRSRLFEHAATRDLYSQDCFIGAAPAHRRSLRVYTETAWASIFARNLFRRPSADDLAAFAPNFTIICVPSFQADPQTEGTRTGTEVGVKEPKATFSACFGAPFMPRHPGEYAHMLVDRLERDDVPVWLVNTGWTSGPYGTGERMNIAHTRSIVRAALDGTLAKVTTRTDPIFGIEVPTTCPNVPDRFLDPRSTWADPAAYDRVAARLARMFADNFEAYADGVSEAVRTAGPRITATDVASGSPA